MQMQKNFHHSLTEKKKRRNLNSINKDSRQQTNQKFHIKEIEEARKTELPSVIT